MNASEAAVVLAKAAAFDRRNVTEQEAVAWAQALYDVPVRDAIDAVVAHFGDSTEWIRPGHVRARVALVRAHRLALATEPVLPPDLSGAEYAAALAEWRRQVADGLAPDLPQLVARATKRALT